MNKLALSRLSSILIVFTLGVSGCKDNKVDSTNAYPIDNPKILPSNSVSPKQIPVNINTASSPTQITDLEVAELYLPLFACYGQNTEEMRPNAVAMMQSKKLASETIELFKHSNGQDPTLKVALAQYNETIDLYTYRLLDDYWEACHNNGGQLGNLPEKRKAILKQVGK